MPPMNRRAFISASVAAALAASRPSWASEPRHSLDRIGVQLYTVRAAMESDCRPDLRVAQVQERFEPGFDLIHGTFVDWRRAGNTDVFAHVAGVLRQRDGQVTREIKGRLTGFVPAVVGGQSREAGVQHLEPRARRNVANGGVAPRMQEGGDHQ